MAKSLPADLVSIIRQLGAENLPAAEIAIMTRVTEEAVANVLATHGPLSESDAVVAVNTTKDRETQGRSPKRVGKASC